LKLFLNAVMLLGTVWATTVFASGSPKRKADSHQFEIVGITLGTSTDGDVQRVLGVAPTRESGEHGIDHRCYASPNDRDDTVLDIGSWTDPVEFSVSAVRDRARLQCVRSDLVSSSIATSAGLKLGLAKKDVIALLGRPTKIQGSRFIYDWSYDRPLTSSERHGIRKHGGPPWEVKSIGVYALIQIDFTHSQVSAFKASFSETE